MHLIPLDYNFRKSHQEKFRPPPSPGTMTTDTPPDTLPTLTFPPSYPSLRTLPNLFSTFKKLLPHEFLRRHLERNIRPSGRSLLESRQVTLSHLNLSSTTYGTVVRIGNTSVVCGISAELAEPTVETPGEGYIGTLYPFVFVR